MSLLKRRRTCLALVVAWWRGQRKVVRIAAAHRVPLLDEVGRSLDEHLLAEALRVARIARDHLLQTLQAELQRRLAHS